MEVLGKIVDYLCRLGPLAEAFLFLEIDRRQHVDQLMICIEGQDPLGIQRPATLSRECVRRLYGRADHYIRQLHRGTSLGVDLCHRLELEWKGDARDL